MAAKVKDLIKALQQFPPETELVDRKIIAIAQGGTAVYDLNLKCRLVGIGQLKEEGLVLLVGYTEDLSKIADIKKIEIAES